MSTIEKFMGICFTLIALGLVLKNAAGFNTVVTSAASGSDAVIGTLQAG